MRSVLLIQSRVKSSLAEKLKNAVNVGGIDGKSGVPISSFTVKDEKGDDFRELFVMPKRKLRGQMQLEHATGRSERKERSRSDLQERLAVRNPRSEEISPEQEWSDVWPAAKTFNASVVPLPIRMGTRPNVEKRAPFKKEGNLELVKIPNFLHLTPAAIEKHCNAIKKFCTPFPKELLQNEQLVKDELPVSINYNTYCHQGTNIRDVRSRIVTVTVDIAKLNLSATAQEKLIRLSKDRYDPETNTLTIISDRCHTRKQNLEYSYYLLTVLFHESQKTESWESMQERQDNLNVEFEGSTTQSKLVDLVQKAQKTSSLNVAVTGDNIQESAQVKEFAEMWQKYRNTEEPLIKSFEFKISKVRIKEETPEATREYAKKVKSLLGLKVNQSSTQAAQQ